MGRDSSAVAVSTGRQRASVIVAHFLCAAIRGDCASCELSSESTKAQKRAQIDVRLKDADAEAQSVGRHLRLYRIATHFAV